MGQKFNLGLALIGLLGTGPRVLKKLRSEGTEFALQTVRSSRGSSEQKLKKVFFSLGDMKQSLRGVQVEQDPTLSKLKGNCLVLKAFSFVQLFLP